MSKENIVPVVAVILAILTFLVFVPQVMFLGVAFGVAALIIGLNRLKHSEKKALPITAVLITVAISATFVVLSWV